MNAKKIVQGTVRFVVGTGTNQIIRAIIANNVEPEKIRERITVEAGTMVISGMVAEAARTYTDAKVEAAFTFYNETVKPRFNK